MFDKQPRTRAEQNTFEFQERGRNLKTDTFDFQNFSESDIGMQVKKLLGVLIFFIVLTSLIEILYDAVIFAGVSGIPVWVLSVLPIIISVFIILILWRTIKTAIKDRY